VRFFLQFYFRVDFFLVTEHLIDQLQARIDTAAEVSKLHLSVMEDLDDAVSHFANHVRACIQHLGPDGFEARFKHPDTNVHAVELVNMFLTEYNLRLRGMAVDSDGQLAGKEVFRARLPSDAKTLLEIDRGTEASSSAGKVARELKTTGEDIEMSAASGPGP
jgi:hypothetical protein